VRDGRGHAEGGHR